LPYTASSIITPIGGRPVHRLREDSSQLVRLMLLRSIRRTTSQLHSLQQIPTTQHDMLPQHRVYKNELNREYVITLERNDENP